MGIEGLASVNSRDDEEVKKSTTSVRFYFGRARKHEYDRDCRNTILEGQHLQRTPIVPAATKCSTSFWCINNGYDMEDDTH